MSEIRIHQVIKVTETHKGVPQKKEVSPEEQISKAPEVNRKSADEVLEYLANSSCVGEKCPPKTKKVVEVSKYVDDVQAARIKEATLRAFEAMLAYEEAFIKEFGMTEDNAQGAAIVAFGQKYLA